MKKGKTLQSAHRREIERSIESALNPAGASIHDGKARIDVNILRRMLQIIDASKGIEEPQGALTETKTAYLEGEGYEKAGYVLRKDGDTCIVANAGVRSMANEEFHTLMHPKALLKQEVLDAHKSWELVRQLAMIAGKAQVSEIASVLVDLQRAVCNQEKAMAALVGKALKK